MNTIDRNYTIIDKFLLQINSFLQTINTTPESSRNFDFSKNNQNSKFPKLNPQEKATSIACMRVNHSGEVAAQALYTGQALFASNKNVQIKLINSAIEENDHLNWCRTRVLELGGKTSILNPLWYWGSFFIGCFAGLCGDPWSLGFIAETEKQVTNHLRHHLSLISYKDIYSQNIINQMMIDETNHAITAQLQGAYQLPSSIKYAMGITSKIMTITAYYA